MTKRQLFLIGRVVNFSSVQGRAAMCLNGIYSCSKFAIDAFSAILRQEMRRFGVKVVIVEPSNFGGATEGLNVRHISTKYIQASICINLLNYLKRRLVF